MFKFSEKLACDVGVNSAIFIERLSLHDVGKTTFTSKDLLDIFPFWNERKIKYIIEKMLNIGFLLKYTSSYGRNGRQILYEVDDGSIYCPVIDLTKLSQGVQNSRLSNARSDKIVIGRLKDKQFLESDLTKLSQGVKLLTRSSSKTSTISLNWENLAPDMYFIFTLCSDIKVYRYNNIILYINIIYNIINNIIYIKNKPKAHTVKKMNSSSLKLPASPEIYLNAKLVLAELNNLLVPGLRDLPFRANDNNLGPIIKQLKNGFTVSDCTRVIKNKFDSWHNVPSLVNALQTKTLFGEKFENYLGEKNAKEINERAKILQRFSERRSISRENAGGIYEDLSESLI